MSDHTGPNNGSFNDSGNAPAQPEELATAWDDLKERTKYTHLSNNIETAEFREGRFSFVNGKLAHTVASGRNVEVLIEEYKANQRLMVLM